MMNNRRPMMPQMPSGLNSLGMGGQQQGMGMGMGNSMMNNGGQASLGMQRPQQRPPMQQQQRPMGMQQQARPASLQNMNAQRPNPQRQRIQQMMQAFKMERNPQRKRQMAAILRQMGII